MNQMRQGRRMRSIDWSINGQLLQAVVVVNRPPFRGALTPASHARQRQRQTPRSAPLQKLPFCVASDPCAQPHTITAIMRGTLPFEVTKVKEKL